MTIDELKARIANDFAYHRPPNDDEAVKLADMRKMFMSVAIAVVDATPQSRDQTCALWHLEDAQRCAIAAIAKTWPVAT